MAVFNIHGGHAPAGKKGSGAVGIVNESIVDREIKNAVIAKLRALGHTAYDCTCENGGSATEVLKDICNKANAHTVDLDVSIHLSCYNGSAKGTEVLVYKLGGKAEQYAKNIVNSISELGYTNRGVKVRNDLYYLKHTKNTALLIETFFCDNQEDVNRYNLDAMANAIVNGITGEMSSSAATPTPQPSEPTKPSGYDEWVARLQQELNYQFKRGLTVDGLKGPKTLNACPTVKKGAKGNVTRLIQERLNSVGFSLGVDGIFGTATYNAVKVFQRNRGLSQDGIVGKNTWNWLLKGTKM
jgi:N-acetylmuramoyl-L-alanine amidase